VFISAITYEMAFLVRPMRAFFTFLVFFGASVDSSTTGAGALAAVRASRAFCFNKRRFLGCMMILLMFITTISSFKKRKSQKIGDGIF
jgi:hypothetical protein